MNFTYGICARAERVDRWAGFPSRREDAMRWIDTASRILRDPAVQRAIEEERERREREERGAGKAPPGAT